CNINSIVLIVSLLFHFQWKVDTSQSLEHKLETLYNADGSGSAVHTNNWAVIVGASRFWFNYRHVANALSIYRSVKRFGIPDSQIILMISDDMACDSRNPKPGTVFNNGQHHINVYGDDVEVDYRGYEVTTENFIRLLTGRVLSPTPKSKRLLTNSGSNILIYMTGHGGDGFLKFQDSEELTSMELANAFEQMHQKQRYNEILFIIDTCQAESMSSKIYSPNIIGIGSSKVGEDSLSHHGDPSIGVYVIDRYTYYVLDFLEKHSPSKTTLNEFFDVCPKRLCISTVSVRTDSYARDPRKVALSDFFGNVADFNIIKEQMIPLNTTLPQLDNINNQSSPMPTFSSNWNIIPLSNYMSN
ncbi:hypothetical protein BLOT_001741, partial [Blomia tropicalis]